jgi:hypothetical protein
MLNLEPGLSAALQRRYLELARAAAERHLGLARAKIPDRWPPGPRCFGGLFVTYCSGPTLRGCVGTFVPTTDLWQAIQDVAIAAMGDPRFADRPITATDLPTLRIELSLLSELMPATEPHLVLKPGVHGIVVRRGDQSGCFLPKVAEQRAWTAEEFLSNCCTMKAGLPHDAWRQPGTDVLLFTATVVAGDGPGQPPAGL